MDYNEHGKERILKGLSDALNGCSWLTDGELKIRIEKNLSDAKDKILEETEEKSND